MVNKQNVSNMSCQDDVDYHQQCAITYLLWAFVFRQTSIYFSSIVRTDKAATMTHDVTDNDVKRVTLRSGKIVVETTANLDAGIVTMVLTYDADSKTYAWQHKPEETQRDVQIIAQMMGKEIADHISGRYRLVR